MGLKSMELGALDLALLAGREDTAITTPAAILPKEMENTSPDPIRAGMTIGIDAKGGMVAIGTTPGTKDERQTTQLHV